MFPLRRSTQTTWVWDRTMRRTKSEHTDTYDIQTHSTTHKCVTQRHMKMHVCSNETHIHEYKDHRHSLTINMRKKSHQRTEDNTGMNLQSGIHVHACQGKHARLVKQLHPFTATDLRNLPHRRLYIHIYIHDHTHKNTHTCTPTHIHILMRAVWQCDGKALNCAKVQKTPYKDGVAIRASVTRLAWIWSVARVEHRQKVWSQM